MNLRKFRSHKVVAAGRIVGIVDDKIHVEDAKRERVTVPIGDLFAFARKRASVGDYYVVYADGYASWSPASAFEEGYYPIDGGVFPEQPVDRGAEDCA